MTKEDLKRRDLIAKAFTSKWRYKTDKEQFGAADSWRIIYYAEILEVSLLGIVKTILCQFYTDCVEKVILKCGGCYLPIKPAFV